MKVAWSQLKQTALGTAFAATLALAGMSSAQALPIDKQLVVNVVQVCNSAGTSCASLGPAGNSYFETETDKIWAQAGIDVKFVFSGTVNNSAWYDSDDGIADIAGATLGPGATMYLVNSIDGAYGNAYLNAGGLAIAMPDVLAFNSPIGRLDTIAHEIGHNLGLDHTANPNDLLASGNIRNIPNSLGQICPDGPCYDFLSNDEIINVRDSGLLIAFSAVPEPGSFALAALGLAGVGGVSRRRRQG